MRALSIPVQFFLLTLLSNCQASGRMTRADEGDPVFSEPRHEKSNEQNQPMKMPVSMGQNSMQPSVYPQEDHFPSPGGDNSQNSNFGRPGMGVADDSWRSSGSMRSRWENGRQLSTSQYDRSDPRPQSTDFYLGQGQRSQSHDYNYRPGSPGRQYGGRSDLSDTPGSSYDIYGVHEQARPVARPEYSGSGSSWPNDDPYNRGYQGSGYQGSGYQGSGYQGSAIGGAGDSRGSYSYQNQNQYPRQGQSPYPYGQDRDRERDYRPRQPYQPEPQPVEVSAGGRRYDNPSQYPSTSQHYESRPAYMRSSYP